MYVTNVHSTVKTILDVLDRHVVDRLYCRSLVLAILNKIDDFIDYTGYRA